MDELFDDIHALVARSLVDPVVHPIFDGGSPIHIAQDITSGSSSKPIGQWVSVCNISGIDEGQSDISLENEVRQCFYNLQGTSLV